MLPQGPHYVLYTKSTKRPHADVTDSSALLTLDQASAGETPDVGKGFVFTKNDPYFFIDIDHCLGPDGKWSGLAVDLCEQFAGCMTEVSLSGMGIHIIGRLSEPLKNFTGRKNANIGLEVYYSERYCALTGTGACGDADFIVDSEILKKVIRDYFSTAQTAPVNDLSAYDGPSEEWHGPSDDDELIKRACKSESSKAAAFGTVTFAQLWTADAQALAKAYPPLSVTAPFDRSSADQALCNFLAFWSGKDAPRIDRLFRRSGLVREKWTDRADYRASTIGNACSSCTSVFGQGVRPVRPASPDAPVHADDVRITARKGGHQYLNPSAQQEYFAGCVYVVTRNKIYCADSGLFLDQQRFNALYGGYDFALDGECKKSTKHPWEAYLYNRAYSPLRVNNCEFRPSHAGQLIVSGALNTYRDPGVSMEPGDVAPFTAHLCRLLPNASDREILTSYLAACVQYKGVKFQWCPLIQGTEGNGKSLFARCLRYAVGDEYYHSPDPTRVAGKYNDWLLDKLVISIEELRVAGRWELMNALKPLITEVNCSVRSMGESRRMEKVYANFIITSNYKDAVAKTKDDRRYCVFYTAQQTASDCARDGMTGSYFPDLYNWLREQGGYSHVAYWLSNYNIPDEYNPAGACQRAPVTSSTDEACTHGLSRLASVIRDLIDEGGTVGMMGGWVCDRRARIAASAVMRYVTTYQVTQAMHELGYIRHPLLRDGRVTKAIPMEQGKKVKLYVREDHPSITSCAGPSAVADAYVADQTTGQAEL